MSGTTRLQRELRRLQYELEVSGQQVPYLRALIEGTTDLLALSTREGEIVEHNAAFAKALGHQPLLVHGLDIRRLFYTKHATAEGSERQPLISGTVLRATTEESTRLYGFFAEELAVEVTLCGVAAGDQQLVVVSARPLDDDAQRARDLHAAEVRVQSLQRELVFHRQQERAARYESLAVLAGTLAHDLNNAMAVLFGNLDLLGEQLEDPELLQLVDDIHESTRATRELATRLGTFSKGSGLVLAHLHLQPWLEAVTRALGHSHRTSITVNMPAADCWIQGDEAQLTQVILNLVSNAIQASDADEVDIGLEVLVSDPEDDLDADDLTISVLDRGCGIQVDPVEKLFEPFFSTKPGGSGLGLASSFRIIDAHGGILDAANRDGGGARFSIRLPRCAPPSTDAEGHPSHPRDSAASPGRLHGYCVLLLDDDPFVRQMLARILRGERAVVLEAARGEEILHTFEGLMARGLPEDTTRLVAILDLNIVAGLDGISTLRQLIAHDPSIRAIACSGHTNHDIANDFRVLGFEAYLAKPFRARTLVDTVLGL